MIEKTLIGLFYLAFFLVAFTPREDDIFIHKLLFIYLMAFPIILMFLCKEGMKWN